MSPSVHPGASKPTRPGPTIKPDAIHTLTRPLLCVDVDKCTGYSPETNKTIFHSSFFMFLQHKR